MSLLSMTASRGPLAAIEYPKIETLFDRNPENMKLVIPGAFRLPEFELVDRWLVTEKVDGTNVRIHMDSSSGHYRFGGRTATAQMPTALLDVLIDRFPYEKVRDAFDPGTSVVIFGEGYGPKIQNGGDYAEGPSFIVFDVAVLAEDRVWWLNWNDVADVAAKIGADVVPSTPDVPLDQAIHLVRIKSAVAASAGKERDQEGIVCRTDPLLFTRKGERLMWKLKSRDLQ